MSIDFSGGRDEESYNGVNEAALRFELLQIPGIRDVVFERQAGTFLCYVYAITPAVAASVLQNVQDRINDRVAFPLTGTAVAPDLVGISLAATLTLTPAAGNDAGAQAISQATAAAEDYINNLTIGDFLVINEIADRIRNASDQILDVGQPNRPLDEIYIWRSRLDGTRYSRSLIANYEPAAGERVMVEDRTGP